MDISQQDFYPGGMLMPGRTFSSDNYRFGYNGKLKDDEVHGSGAWYDYGMRPFDSRLVRFPNPDPITAKFPMLSPYQYASNNPIMNIDLDGLEGKAANYETDNKGNLTNSSAAQDNVGNHNLPPATIKSNTPAEPLLSVNVTVGPQVALQVGNVGGEVNLGSPTALQYNIYDKVNNPKESSEKGGFSSPFSSNPKKQINETTKGFGLNIGIIGVSGQQTETKETITETIQGPFGSFTQQAQQITLVQTGSINLGNSLLNIGGNVQQTAIAKISSSDVRILMLGKQYSIESSLNYKPTVVNTRAFKIAIGIGIEIK